jgi:hypothetical protein
MLHLVALFLALRCLGLGLEHCLRGLDVGLEHCLRGLDMDFQHRLCGVDLDFLRNLRGLDLDCRHRVQGVHLGDEVDLSLAGWESRALGRRAPWLDGPGLMAVMVLTGARDFFLKYLRLRVFFSCALGYSAKRSEVFYVRVQ